MAYQLTKELETGNTLIDGEHRQLIQAINDLLDACAQGRGRAEIQKTTKFLQEYTTKHFADEERLQKDSGYPDFSNHKRYHETFKKVVAELMQKLNEQGPTVQLVGEVNSALAGWLISHIKREDKKLAAFLRDHQSPRP